MAYPKTIDFGKLIVGGNDVLIVIDVVALILLRSVMVTVYIPGVNVLGIMNGVLKFPKESVDPSGAKLTPSNDIDSEELGVKLSANMSTVKPGFADVGEKDIVGVEDGEGGGGGGGVAITVSVAVAVFALESFTII